jgi:PAS domain S-box-containing protein
VNKLYKLYIVLAAFIVLTTTFGLVVQRGVMSAYDASAANSSRFVDHKAAFDRLRLLGGRVESSANEVFETGDVGKQSAQTALAFAEFEQSMHRERQNIIDTEAPDDAKLHLAEMANVEAAMRAVVREANSSFDALRHGRSNEAVARMARMNHAYDRVRKEMSDFDNVTTSLRQRELEHRTDRAEAIHRRYAYVSAGLIALSLIAVALYGRRMLREALAVKELRRANTALEDAIEGISFVDKEKKYTYANRAFAKALGYEPEELVGMPFIKTMHPDDMKKIAQANRENRDKRKSECEIRGVRKDGSAFYTRVVMVASFDERGKFVGYYCFAKDITKEKLAEAALRRSEERFHLAARATNNIVFEWDFKTGAAWVNEALQEHFGFSESGDIDHSVWSNAVHPGDADRVLGGIQAAITAGDEFWSGEYRFRRGDGVYADVVSDAFIVRDAAGVPLRMIGATMDITERKRAERAYNTQILNAAADGIFGFDMNGFTTFVNQSTARLLGWSVQELLGKNMHDLAHKHHADRSPFPWNECDAYKTLQTGETTRNTGDLWKKDGSLLTAEYEVTAICDSDNVITGAVVTFRDITERRTVERLKDEFVSIVSHELRTPLTAIRGALGLMAGGRIGEIPAKAQRMLDIAVSNTDRLVRLINDILDIERMDSGKVALTRQLCDAKDLMSQAIDLIKPMADKAGVSLECRSCDAALFADSDRILQTFTNLLGNAVKFSPRGSTVSLTARIKENNVLFEVADEGRGIPGDKLELIFERFLQIDASDSREKGGSGLGLPICRSIVRQHGGEIWAESNDGHGSRFLFTIPRVTPDVTALPSAGRTILVCDDDPSVREVMCALLDQRGYHAMGVSSGRELIDRAPAIAPDAIVLDLLMPGLNGCETLAILKSNPITASIPVVIASVFSPTESDWPISDLAGWIQKPLDERAIVDTLERAFEPRVQKMVLLVEDDLDLARVIAASFDRKGVQTVHASSGRVAIELAQKVTPDLVVLDLILPDIDGYAVVDWLKDHDLLRSVPVVVYSATEPSPSQRERLTLGPTEFLTKSRISPEDFERRVIQLLDNMIMHGEGKQPRAA